MGDRTFVVVEFNQASGSMGDDQHVTFWDDLLDAQGHAEELTAENRRVGRRETYRVFELVELFEVEP